MIISAKILILKKYEKSIKNSGQTIKNMILLEHSKFRE